jgi:S1-C subfamily serine protease
MKLAFFFAIVILNSFSSANVSADSLPDVVERIKGSVVAVGTIMPKRSPKNIFLGTGFVIGDGRLIVTNAHVLPKEIDSKGIERIAVFVRKNKNVSVLEAKIVATDAIHDIAILQLVSGALPALKISDKAVREGQSIVFTGYPIGMVLGLYPVTHRGIISAITPVVLPAIKSRQINAKLLRRLRDPFDVYQLDATAYPGNSGSPVYSVETGNVIGIVNKVFVKESKENMLSKPSGITYAIPIRYLNNLLIKKNLL